MGDALTSLAPHRSGLRSRRVWSCLSVRVRGLPHAQVLHEAESSCQHTGGGPVDFPSEVDRMLRYTPLLDHVPLGVMSCLLLTCTLSGGVRVLRGPRVQSRIWVRGRRAEHCCDSHLKAVVALTCTRRASSSVTSSPPFPFASARTLRRLYRGRTRRGSARRRTPAGLRATRSRHTAVVALSSIPLPAQRAVSATCRAQAPHSRRTV